MRKKILIIEDESSIADNITYALENENFIPIWKATAGEGEAVLASEKIDLIVLDVGLPDINGFDLCRKIRKRSDVPIIFLTARSEEIDRIVGLEIGGDDYVSKPFSPRELAARVKAILRRFTPGENVEVRQSGKTTRPFSVISERCEILYYNEPLKLSPYEYKILLTLIRHPGRIYSRKQLMEIVWEEPEASMERTVDTHIKTIRAKLHRIRSDLDPIITHRGFGYSLSEQ